MAFHTRVGHLSASDELLPRVNTQVFEGFVCITLGNSQSRLKDQNDSRQNDHIRVAPQRDRRFLTR